jgi:hypothetical protein
MTSLLAVSTSAGHAAAQSQNSPQGPIDGAFSSVHALSRSLSRLGDTYALIVLGSVLAVSVLVLVSTEEEARSGVLRVGGRVTGVCFALLLALGGISIIWKLTIALTLGFVGWYLSEVVIPSLELWRPDEDE